MRGVKGWVLVREEEKRKRGTKDMKEKRGSYL